MKIQERRNHLAEALSGLPGLDFAEGCQAEIPAGKPSGIAIEGLDRHPAGLLLPGQADGPAGEQHIGRGFGGRRRSLAGVIVEKAFLREDETKGFSLPHGLILL